MRIMNSSNLCIITVSAVLLAGLCTKDKYFLESGKEYVLDMQAELRDAFGMKVRNITGWASCLFFLKQVNFRIGVVHSNKGVSFCIE